MKKIIAGIICCLSVSNIYANNGGPLILCGPGGSWYYRGSVGYDFLNADNNNYINPGTGWPNDHYFRTGNVSNVAEFSIGFGYTFITQNDQYFPYWSLGIDYTYALPASYNGRIQQYSLPEFENYTFNYQIQRQSLLGTVKVNLVKLNRFMPYLALGFGASFNTGQSYKEHALPNVTPRVSPGFGSGTKTTFAYTLGVGVDYRYTPCWMYSLEFNVGKYKKAETGKGRDYFTLTGENYSNTYLKNNFWANSVLFRVTYFSEFI